MQSRTGWLLGILLLAFVLRGATAMVLQWRLDRPPKRLDLIEGDASGYLLLADRIADGESYEIYTPPRRVLRMPGFPVLLAFVRLFTDRLLYLRLALCVVGTVACALVYWLGRELVGVDVGLAAAGLGAASPIFIGFTPLILSETLFAATLVASLIPLSPLFRRHMSAKVSAKGDVAPAVRGAWLSAVAGVLMGVACYVRPSWLLAAPMFAGLLVLVSVDKSRAAMHGAVLVAAVLLSLVPWGLRNRAVTGHFVLTTLWDGPSLYDGLNPKATGDSDMSFYDEENLMSKMSEYDVNRNYRDRAWQFVRDNPGRTFDLALIKFGRFWKPWPSAPQFDRWWAKAAVAAWFIPLVVLSLIGISRLGDNWPALLLCVSPIIYFTAIHLLFVSSLRYRLPAEYPLLVPAAAGLWTCLEWRRSRTPQPLGHQFADGG